MKDFDKRKMLDVLMDPNVSEILAELENGERSYAHLIQKLQISETEINNRLSYAVEHGFVVIKQDGNGMTMGVDRDKLNEIMTSDENFDSVVDGLTGLDQFLN